MKRYTLCKICLCMLLLIGGKVGLWALSDFSQKGSDKAPVPEGALLVMGRVSGIEERQNSYIQKQYVISLKSVTFCNGDFQDQNIIEQGKWQDGYGKAKGALCYLKKDSFLPCMGEWIVLQGKAEPFSSARNPGEFDAAFYYRTKELEFLVKEAELLQRDGQWDVISQRLFLWRLYLGEKLDQICDEDAGIMQSLLLGNKALLSGEIKDLYQRGGISHILAISGLHISFFGAGLYRLLKKLYFPVPAAVLLSGSLLLAYGIMTGLSPSACRAVMMFLFCLAADLLRRSYERRTALAFSAVVLILQNPLLLCQSGFWLSYGAVFGLEMLTPILNSLWENKVCRLLAGSVSVSLITLPVLLLSYYEFPVYSFLLNLAVIPLMSVVMAMGSMALLAGLCWLPLGRLLFYPVHVILYFFQTACRLSMKLPGNQWIVGKPEPWRIYLYVLLLLLFLALARYMTKTNAVVILLGAVWILTGMVTLKGSVTVLDVGQGDGIVIRSRNGTALMIDGGSSSEKELGEYTLIPYLKSQGIKKLPYVFLTHMDTDHIGGIRELLEKKLTGWEEIEIGALVLPRLMQPDEEYWQMVRLAERAGVSVWTMEKGDVFRLEEICLVCMHPQRQLYQDRNEASLVLELQMDSIRGLFMGDLDGGAEKAFAEAYPKKQAELTLLKVGHHGSSASCSWELLEKVKPRYAVISCGADNSYGHPAAETLERLLHTGCTVLTTKEYGAVTLKAEKLMVTVESRERYVIK